MVDVVSYCIVMWLAIIQIIRSDQREWASLAEEGIEPRKKEAVHLEFRNTIRLIRKFMEDVFRRKGDVLWDTS